MSRLVLAARREWSLCLAALVALALRAHQLASQVLVGDEWHALEKAARSGFAEIASSFGDADHSIPIALYYRALSRTVGLTDAAIRAPFLLAGLAAVVLLPLAARRVAGRAAATLFAWLLAVSPLEVFYSRFARPYALTTPLALAALLAFLAWWRGRERAWALAYVLLAVAAAALHASVLPFVVAPLAYGLAAALRSERRAADVRALCVLGAALALALAAPLAAPALLDPGTLGRKAGWGAPGSVAALETLRILAGTGSPAAALVVWAPAALGALLLARDAPREAALFLTAGAAQLAALLVVQPVHPSDTFALARYLLPLLPCALLAAARGVAAALRGSATAAALAGPALAAALLALGPLPETWPRPDNWSANRIALALLGKRAARGPSAAEVPAFYRDLGRRPAGSVVLVETPWSFPLFANPLPGYQRVHRQWTRVGLTGAPVPGELPREAAGFALRNFVRVEDLLGPGPADADLLVVHVDLAAELGPVPGGAVLSALAAELRVDVGPLIARCRRRFGPPVHEDERLVVFALAGAGSPVPKH